MVGTIHMPNFESWEYMYMCVSIVVGCILKHFSNILYVGHMKGHL